MDVEVEYSYDAEQPDELTIKVGDIIRNVTTAEGGWWEGELNGKKGMFPDNFVKVIKNTADKDKDSGKKEEKKKDVQASKRQSVRDLANKLKLHDGPAPIRKKETKKRRAKVTFSYEPENEDELKLEVGEIVEILKQEEEGWWEGIVNGKQGMLPSNFVEIIEEGEGGDSADKSEPAEPETLIKGKKVHGVGLGNIFGDGPIKLRSTGGKKPVEKPQEPPKTEKKEPEAPVQRRSKDVKPVEKAIVRYSYQAENEDELTLTEGEVIVVLEKELEDSGWWKGQLNDKIGLFPDNFVELIKEERAPEKAPRPVINPTPQPKPKKPPPPAQVPVQKQPPRIPDKAPAPEHSKPEPVKEEKPQMRDHPVPPSKKHMPPPPLSKKPSKPVDVHKEHKEEEKVKQEPSFEAVEPAGDKLTHLTANRARGPAKRPPSQVFFQNPKSVTSPTPIQEEERNGDVKEGHWAKEERQSGGHVHGHVPHTVPEKKEEHHHVPEKTVPVRPPEPSHASLHLQSAIDELRREVAELRANTVSKTAFNELKSENEKLRQELDTVKTTNSRRLKEIMEEVDEEKKIRLSTQVEMERIRKLVTESHV